MMALTKKSWVWLCFWIMLGALLIVVLGIAAEDPSFTAFKTPIELYGKVMDQHGDPVPAATVKLFPVDTPGGDESKSQVTLSCDADGKFSAKGLRGFSMGIQATKNGYLYLSPLGGPTSSAMIQYANGADTGKRFSNPATPLILTLQKVGPLEPIFYIEKTRWKIPIDGTIRKIALDSKEGVGKHQPPFPRPPV